MNWRKKARRYIRVHTSTAMNWRKKERRYIRVHISTAMNGRKKARRSIWVHIFSAINWREKARCYIKVHISIALIRRQKGRRYIRVHWNRPSKINGNIKQDVVSGYTYLQQVGDKSKTLYQGTHICSRLGTKARRYIWVHISTASWGHKTLYQGTLRPWEQMGTSSKTLYRGPHICKCKTLYQGTHICKSKTLYQVTYISTARCGTKARSYIKVHLHVYLQQTRKNVISKCTYISRANW